MGFVTMFLVIIMLRMASSTRTIIQQFDAKVINVLDFGAIGDGLHDDSKAFLAAWASTCGARIGATSLTIPAGKTYLLSPLEFKGPCKPLTINVHVMGRLVAIDIRSWPKQKSLKWILFSHVKGLIVNGNGVIDGKGSKWWAKYKEKTHKRPTGLAFDGCDNLQLLSLTHINSARNHISIHECRSVIISNLEITAPEDSPNTDGINLSRSTNVNISSSIIATGDDCIAINGETANLNIMNIWCGPGHGISIGSLGEDGSTDTVENIHVKHVTLYKTKYGARIKTWQGGQGYARHISFEDITLVEVYHPIIINQFYCDSHSSAPCKKQSKAVRINDVLFGGFHGTAAGDDAIQLHCSEKYGCSGIVLNNIDISPANPDDSVSSSCMNAHGTTMGIINPVVDCLQP